MGRQRTRGKALRGLIVTLGIAATAGIPHGNPAFTNAGVAVDAEYSAGTGWSNLIGTATPARLREMSSGVVASRGANRAKPVPPGRVLPGPVLPGASVVVAGRSGGAPPGARGARAVRAARGYRRSVATPQITTPADGQLVDRHEAMAAATGVPVAWTTVAEVRHHLVTLVDLTVGDAVWRDRDVGTATALTVPDAELRYGHDYAFTVAAVTAGGPRAATSRFTVRVLPELTDPADLRLDAGQLDWDGCDPALLASRNAFERLLAARGWTVRYQSAHRSLRYQEHLYLAVVGGGDATIGAAGAALLAAERVRHGLGQTVAPPTPADTHVRGVAFDAQVFDRSGRPLNTRTWRDSRVERLAAAVGLTMLPVSLNDSVHFQRH